MILAERVREGDRFEISAEIEGMLGEAVLGDRETVRIADAIEQLSNLRSAIHQRAVCSPSNDHEVGLLGKTRDVAIVVWTDGIVDLLEPLGIGGTQREDIDDIHRAESPTHGVAVATRQGWIEDFGIGGGWIEQAEADALTSLGPSSAERIAVLLAIGKLRPTLHLDHPCIVFPVAGSMVWWVGGSQ